MDGGFYRYLDSLVRRMDAGVAGTVRKALLNLREQVSEDQIEQALKSGHVSNVENLFNWQTLADELGVVVTPLRQAVISSADHVAGEIADKIQEAIDPARLASRSARYASSQAAELVTAVSRETRFAVRELVTQSFVDNKPFQPTARSIRQIVGFNRPQAGALEKFSAARFLEVEKGEISRAKALQLIDRERRAKIRYRSETIAKTELWTAGNRGQLEAWQQAVDERLIEIVGLDADFVSSTGERAHLPPIHVKCGCASRLIRTEVNGRTVYARQWVISPGNPCPRCIAFNGVIAA